MKKKLKVPTNYGITKKKQTAIRKRLEQLVGILPTSHPTPERAHITLEASTGAPLLAGMIARLLIDAGATCTVPDVDYIPAKTPDLGGLHVHFGRTVWVRQEQSERYK